MRSLFIVAISLSVSAFGQIVLDKPISFMGPVPERGVYGIATAEQDDQLITVESAANGSVHWADAVMVQDSIFDLSSTSVPVVATEGLLLRFLSPGISSGALYIQLDAATTLPLKRPDGLNVIHGQLVQGSVCEVLYKNGEFILTAPERRSCPIGSLPISSRICVDSSTVAGLNFFGATSFCTDRGGRLCTWAEYYTTCSSTDVSVGDLFSNWEWADDTGNHTHTIGQVGAVSCMSQRSVNTLPQVTGNTRCCYRIR